MSEVHWLHISDLHRVFGAESEGFEDLLLRGRRTSFRSDDEDEAILSRAGLCGLLSKTPVDCVVITGDVFNKGAWDRRTAQRAQKFIESVAGAAGRRDGRVPRILICPGNHDLQRDTSIVVNGMPVSRGGVIEKVARDSSSTYGEGYATCGDPEKEVLRAAFEPFVAFASGIERGAEGDDGSTETRTEKMRSGATVDFVEGDGDGDGEPLRVAFFGLNTALLSGQPCDRATLGKQARALLEQFDAADREMRYAEASRLYEQYAAISERALQGIGDDKGKLSPPFRDAVVSAENAFTMAPCPVSVLYMHHPVGHLNDEARKSLSNFLGRVGGQVILCGHVHRPALEKDCVVSAPSSYSRGAAVQVCAGGSFPDSEGYSCVSFSIGSIRLDGGQERWLDISVDLYSYVKSPLDEWFWHHEEMTKSARGIAPGPARADGSGFGVPGEGSLGEEENRGASGEADYIREEWSQEEIKMSKEREKVSQENLLSLMRTAKDELGLGEMGRGADFAAGPIPGDLSEKEKG